MSDYLRCNIEGFETIKSPGIEGGPAVIVLHGWGANFQDLAPLSKYIGAPKGTTWYFPNALKSLDHAGIPGGRAWFHIDIQAFEKAQREGTFREFGLKRPEGSEGVKNKMKAFYNHVRTHHTKVVIGGFSQGAMVATDCALDCEPSPEGLMILSGAIIDKEGWAERAEKIDPLYVLQSHGEADPILSFQNAQELSEMLKSYGHHCHFYSFSGGHEIPPFVIKKMSEFLMSHLGR